MTYGIGVEPVERWPAVLANDTGLVIQDYSRSGLLAREFRKAANRLFGTMITKLDAPTATVVFMLGTNDWGTDQTLGSFRSSMRRIVRAVPDNVDIVGITPPPRCQEVRGDPKRGGPLEGFRQVVRDVCPGIVLEGPEVLPWAADPLNFADCVHPSAVGHSLIADAVRNVLD